MISPTHLTEAASVFTSFHFPRPPQCPAQTHFCKVKVLQWRCKQAEREKMTGICVQLTLGKPWDRICGLYAALVSCNLTKQAAVKVLLSMFSLSQVFIKSAYCLKQGGSHTFMLVSSPSCDHSLNGIRKIWSPPLNTQFILTLEN